MQTMQILALVWNSAMIALFAMAAAFWHNQGHASTQPYKVNQSEHQTWCSWEIPKLV